MGLATRSSVVPQFPVAIYADVHKTDPKTWKAFMTERVPNTASRLLSSPNAFKLMPFGFNNNGGSSLTTEPGVPKGVWDENVRIAQAAEAADFDGIVSGARWVGFGGKSKHNERSFETFAWAAGLAAVTEKIQIFTTYHIPTAHPVRVAKMAATVDHISGGRFGLNIVAGWNESEIGMFGTAQREHDERYEIADEFMEVLYKLWNEEGYFDHHGRFFDIEHAFSEPKPIQSPRPVLMGAGISPRGRAFAAKHCDLSFNVVPDLEFAKGMVADTKRMAKEDYGREIQVFGLGAITCADTEKEAKRRFDSYVEKNGDRVAANNLLDQLMPNSATGEIFEREAMVKAAITGFGAQPLVGTPEQVVEQMIAMSETGMDGITLSWVNYEEGIAQYKQDLLPLLIEAGLRVDESRTPVPAA